MRPKSLGRRRRRRPAAFSGTKKDKIDRITRGVVVLFRHHGQQHSQHSYHASGATRRDSRSYLSSILYTAAALIIQQSSMIALACIYRDERERKTDGSIDFESFFPAHYSNGGFDYCYFLCTGFWGPEQYQSLIYF